MAGSGSGISKTVLIVIAAALGFSAGLGVGRSFSEPRAVLADAWTDARPTRGPEDAVVTIEEFTDYECPACRQFHAQTHATLLAEYGDRVRYTVRHFPLENLHPNAKAAARGAVCAHQQGRFWEYHEALFDDEDPDLSREALLSKAAAAALDPGSFESCLDSESSADFVAGDFLYGVSRNVRSTPTIFVNDQMVVGAQPLDRFREIIEQELASREAS
jgi:protein-disulfide isomerase